VCVERFKVSCKREPDKSTMNARAHNPAKRCVSYRETGITPWQCSSV